MAEETRDQLLEKAVVEERANGSESIDWRMSALFLVLLLLFIYLPLEPILPLRNVNVLFVTVMVAAVYVVARRRIQLIISIALAILVLIFGIVSNIDSLQSPELSIVSLLTAAIFVIYVLTAIIMRVLRTETVTVHAITGALSVYLLLALLWALFYSITEIRVPGSFDDFAYRVEDPDFYPVDDLFPTLSYFSAITITTVGYGDVIPVHPVAQALAMVEGMTGQIFLAVLVAWLVGMYISHSMQRN